MASKLDYCFSASKHFCAVPVAEQQVGGVLVATAELCALNVMRLDATLRTQAVSPGAPGCLSFQFRNEPCDTISDSGGQFGNTL